MFPMRKKTSGFTLIEMIMVIVIMGILALVSVRFVGHSAQGMIDVSDRQRLAGIAAIAAEKILREVRSALPNSVRIFTDGGNQCLEIVPITNSSEYLSVPVSTAATSFNAVELQSAVGNEQGFVAVYPDSAGNIYTLAATGTISNKIAIAGAPVGNIQTFTFDEGVSHQFLTDSPTSRFYLVSEPVAFCNDGAGRIWRYSNYGFEPTEGDGIPAAGNNRRLLADSLLVNSLQFDFTPAQLQRNAVVRMSMVLQRPGSLENVDFSQEVQIRNVP